jgi:ankyrin repeat protein
MYPALQVARIDTLRRTKEQQCKELLAEWRKNLSTASLQLKECGRFIKEQRTKHSMLAVTRLHIAVEGGGVEELKRLLVKHPNKNIQDRRGWTALHSAAQVGNPEAVEVLLQAGLDPDARDKNGAAPLHLAAFAGHVKIIKRLAAVADVNPRTNSGATPLHAAVLGGNLEAARALLDNGADADAEDVFGRTPIFYAKIVQEPKLEKLFTE